MSQTRTPSTKLHVMHFGGNLYDAAQGVNDLGWSDFLLQIDSSGRNSAAVLRFPVDWPFDERGPLTWTKAHEASS